MPKLLAQMLFDGITVRVGQIGGGQAKIGIEAPIDLQMPRGELEEQ
ncbi:carbon storage regulator [Stutzerimonas xanthomarina]